MSPRKDGAPKARRSDWESVSKMLERLSMPITECGCWAWLGKIGTGGYPHISYREGDKRYCRKTATVAYELTKGQVPEGLEVSHTCLQEWCVNPNHLIAETHLENMQRVRLFDRRKWKGLCKQGHVLPPREDRNKNGSCPICYAEYQEKWKAENKQYEVDYREANKDRINANRRARRSRTRLQK